MFRVAVLGRGDVCLEHSRSFYDGPGPRHLDTRFGLGRPLKQRAGLYCFPLSAIMVRWLVATVVSLGLGTVRAWNCYLPAGNSDNKGMTPCNITLADTEAGSSCCDPRDSCTTSGMCLGGSGMTYRGGCTDSSFGSPNCPAICITGRCCNNDDTDQSLMPCRSHQSAKIQSQSEYRAVRSPRRRHLDKQRLLPVLYQDGSRRRGHWRHLLQFVI